MNLCPCGRCETPRDAAECCRCAIRRTVSEACSYRDRFVDPAITRRITRGQVMFGEVVMVDE